MRGEEARERIRRIFENGPRLAGFYSFAINNPHLSFWNAVQIYSANPNVTVCKSFDDWHEQDNRRIKRGEHGIVYYDEDNPWRKRHVFDISQTYGKERYRGVQHRMQEKMLADCINGQNIFAGISRDRNSHYGTLRKEFLKTEFPMQYQILLMTGGLSAHLKKTEKAAQALKRRLTAEVLSDNLSSNYLKNLQDNRMAEMEIERTILEEIVYQPLETTD